MFEQFKRDDKGVSPVIGVILMVAITVILAAVIGTFVLNLGGSVQQNVQAGANVECNSASSADGDIQVTFTSNQNADDGLTVSVTVQSGGLSSTSDTDLPSVGDSATYEENSEGSPTEVDVTVTANAGDQSTVIATKTCEI